MEKKRSFLGFLASLFIVFITTNSFAAGYMCNDLKEYTSCNANYYLNKSGTGNACIACDTGYTKPANANIGPANCTKNCTVNCKKQTCPANASCTHGTETASGTRNQTQAADVCSATQPTCSITISCEASYYKTSSNTCQACSAGQYSAKGDNTCKTCTNTIPANSYYSGNATSNACPWACNAAYYKSGNTCQACSNGQYSAKGDNTCKTCTNTIPANSHYSGNATSNACPWTCNDNYHKLNNTCVADTYTITYDLNGGTKSSSGMPTSYTYGIGATINGIPTKNGATFVGWCTNSDCTSYDMTQTISASDTGAKKFYAKWEACTCSEGLGVESCTAIVSSNICNRSATCSPGYNTPICSSYFCRCDWNTFYITYNGGGGEGNAPEAPISCQYNSGCSAPENTYSRPGYTFKNWKCTDSKGNLCQGGYSEGHGSEASPGIGISLSTQNNGETITLTAQWTPCTVCDPTNANCSLSIVNNQCTYTTTCKGGFYNLTHSGEYNPKCSQCANGTYTPDGNTATSCTPCSNSIPAHSHYSSNATSNACEWACDDGYHKNGSVCELNCSTARACSADFTGYTGTYNQCEQDQEAKCSKKCSGNNTSDCPANSSCTYNTNYSYLYPNSGLCPRTSFSCDANFYKNGSACTGCNTGFSSPAGSTTSTACTRECDKSCSGNDTGNCPANATCSYNSTKTYPGIQTQGSSTCVTTETSTLCPRTGFSCNSGYYKDTSNSCAKLPEGGKQCPDGSVGLCCEDGYTKSGDGLSCNPNKYNVTYNCGAGTGTAPTANQATYNASYTPKENTCTPATSEYQFVGWKVSGTTNDTKTPGANFVWKYLENKTFTAQWVAGDCAAGKYKSGDTCVSCPTSHPSSDFGDNGDINKCYTTCTVSCTAPGSCPAHATRCPTIDSTVTGKRYYNEASSVCNTSEVCAYNGELLRCESNYYNTYYQYSNATLTKGGPISCSACSAIPGYANKYMYSAGYTTGTGSAITSCYGYCSYTCPLLNAGDSKRCPEHAKTCTPLSSTITGMVNYPDSPTEKCYEGMSECQYTIVCEDGYDFDATNVKCNPKVIEISLDHNGGSSTVSKIYEKYSVGYSLTNFGATVTKITAPTRDTYAFTGYYTAATGGDKIIDTNGNIVAASTKFTKSATIYAQWTRLTTSCQVGKEYNGSAHVNCSAGKYCPGTGEAVIGTAGCATTCPSDASGGTVTSATGSSTIEACMATRVNINVTGGKATQTCHYNATPKTYGPSNCETTVTSCSAGYYRPAPNSQECSETTINNYSPADKLEQFACSALSGGNANTQAPRGSTAPTACYNTCSSIPIDNGNRVPTQDTIHYNGTTIPGCTYTTSCNPGYKPSGTTCVAKVLTITLNHDNGKPNSTIYLKYKDGWYSSETASAGQKITSVSVPQKGDSDSFSGYRSANGDTVVEANGKLTTNFEIFTDSATITADWTNRTPITCPAGKYYTGTGASCTSCTAGSYCPGVETYQGIGSARGINTCASLNGTATPAKAANGTTMSVSISSAPGAKAATECFATNVAYSTTTTGGSQTCYYVAASNQYTGNCKSMKVITCTVGYWLDKTKTGVYSDADSDPNCSEADYGYYSAESETVRHACPNLNDGIGVTTKDKTSGLITQCYLQGVWYEPDANTGLRRNCHHNGTATTDAEAGYTNQCDIAIVVACGGGYYDDGTSKNVNNVRICAKITDKNSYSPDQSYFVRNNGELLQPTQEAPGSSTKLHSCPATKKVDNGTAKRVFQSTWTASDYAKCEYKAADCDTGYRAVTSGDVARCVWDDPDACPEGYYCPDGSDEPIPCPRDSAGTQGTTEQGAKAITACFIKYDPYTAFQNGTGSAICNWSLDSSSYSRCHDITAKTCDAGYWYRDNGSITCVEVVSGNYSPSPSTKQKACPVGGNGSNQFADNWDDCYKNCVLTVANSETVAAKDTRVFGTSATGYAPCSFNVTCKPGYTVNDNNTATPSCDANRYTVTLDKNGGTGSVADSVQCTFNSGACALPATTGLTRAGYSVNAKWCTAKDGTGTCYNGGTTVTGNISATGVAVTLYAIWTPNVYTVTLRHPDATVAAVPVTAYLKYATGWFSDETATLPLSKLSTLPSKSGYEFAGYVSSNKTSIIAANGTFQTTNEALTFTTTNADINVVWSAGNTQCPAGKYYVGTGSVCAPCTDNHYCPGGSYPTDAGEAGKNACRDGGLTAPGSAASSETECFKENLPTYVATHGTGTEKCYFDTDKLTYSANCTDKFITSCDAGYWKANKSLTQTAPDCEAVGNGYFSADEDPERTACPNGGTTAETTAATVQRCFKSGMDYAAEFGTGTQRCYYSSGEGTSAIYNRECDTKTITKCRGGYWLDAEKTTIDCSPVGYNNYSEDGDTVSHACEGGGKTKSETTDSPLSCYRDSEVYTAAHGGGYRTCYYTSGTGENALYETSCEIPTLTYCNGGYYENISINTDDCIEVGYGFWSPAPTPSHLAESLVRTACGEGETTPTPTSESAAACEICKSGQICTPDGKEPKTCAELTKGTHPKSDPGSTDVSECWRDCAVVTNAATMKGHDYFGKPSTCEIEYCKAGFTYNKTAKACEVCPEGMFCGGGDDCPAGQNCDTPKSCADLGDGKWKYSDTGATGPQSCYQKCAPYKLEGGTAKPISDRAYYANQCEYKGFDDDGNPCDIENGTCVTTSCKPSFEMKNGKCVACNRDHALTYKSTGNCMVETCEPGWHPYGQSCEGDIKDCPAPNALRAEQQWDYKKNTYGICLIKECEEGFHISSNACVADIQECAVEHGRGEKEWNHTTNTWGDCVATYCDPGWTNDPYETNEPTKPCGHCKNKFGEKGELVASSYSRGCTISACMYQGEKYNLENNECNLICPVEGYSDDTGTKKWNPTTQKCERTCNEGYVMW